MSGFMDQFPVERVIGIDETFQTEKPLRPETTGPPHSRGRFWVIEEECDRIGESLAVFLLDEQTGLLVYDDFRKPPDPCRHHRPSHHCRLQGYQTESLALGGHHDHRGSVHQLWHLLRGDPPDEIDRVSKP